MKQILFTALAAAAVLLSSCSKDDNGNGTDPTNPIKGLEMPASSAEQPVSACATVSIKGTGFTASDEIWFAAAVKASTDVKAEGVVATATGLSFIAPAIDGETSVTLKQAGKSYPLGKMFFATKGNSLTEHVYMVKETDDVCEFFEYDLDKGTFTSVFQLPVTASLGFVSDNRSNIYYVANDYTEPGNIHQYVARCNLNEKKEVRMSNKLEGGYTSIGMIDNVLHLMKYDEATGYNLMSVTDDGKETLVKAFGQLLDQNYKFFEEDDDVCFIYDPASKSIVLAGSSEYKGGRNWLSTILSFSMETGVITIKNDPNTNNWFDLAKTATGVLLFNYQEDEEVFKTRIDYIEPTTLANKSAVATVNCLFNVPVYVSSKNILLGVDDARRPSSLMSYDLTTKNLKQIAGSDHCGYVFTMFY